MIITFGEKGFVDHILGNSVNSSTNLFWNLVVCFIQGVPEITKGFKNLIISTLVYFFIFFIF